MFELTAMGVMGLQVHLERFEGPLALLLHLIREQEMDIFDIDIARITQQYLDYIRTMKNLDLEGAGDFVAMAATLLQIKSRMLLPNYNEAGEEVETEDPRKELVQRLLEYEKFQEASKQLKQRYWVNRDVWLRGERLDLTAAPTDEVELEDNPLFSLISSYRKVVRAMKSGVHKVFGAMQSIAARILEMKDLLVPGRRAEFTALITETGDKKQGQILVTFLSLLELAKMGFVSLFQAENFGQIHIDTKKVIDRDVVSQVENYDNVESEVLAEQILAESVSETQTRLVPDEEEEAAAADAATDEEIFAEEQRLGVEGESSAAPVQANFDSMIESSATADLSSAPRRDSIDESVDAALAEVEAALAQTNQELAAVDGTLAIVSEEAVAVVADAFETSEPTAVGETTDISETSPEPSPSAAKIPENDSALSRANEGEGMAAGDREAVEPIVKMPFLETIQVPGEESASDLAASPVDSGDTQVVEPVESLDQTVAETTAAPATKPPSPGEEPLE